MSEPFPTYWNVDVQTYTDGRAGTSCSTGDATLEKALERGIESASYYRFSCGYERITIELTEECARCYNRGEIIHPGGRKRPTRCPACKGKVATAHIGPFEFRVHENALADMAAR